MTTGYALAVAIFGGFAPFISIWLIESSASPIAPIYYLIAAAIVSFGVIWSLKETAHRASSRLMLIRFDGKRVIVAGAARGIGQAIAVAFADDGARRHRLRPAGRRDRDLAGAARRRQIGAAKVDVTDQASIDEVVRRGRRRRSTCWSMSRAACAARCRSRWKR